MRSTKILGYVDSNAEIHEGVVPVLVGQRVPSPYGVSWMQVNQDFLREFSARRDVTGEVLRVFLYLFARECELMTQIYAVDNEDPNREALIQEIINTQINIGWPS